MKKTSKLIGEIVNVILRYSWLFVLGMAAGCLILLGLIKFVEIIIKVF
tara:strand:- start:814 stop:957 length:144 start_codon:yes stop_codon:yes gene_type:complete